MPPGAAQKHDSPLGVQLEGVPILIPSSKVMTRRALLASIPALHIKAAPARRNVLFIAVDDLNDWIGCLGGPAITPNIDRLAGQGVLFTNAHCAAPLCNPSRAAIMTGRRPSSSGVYENSQPYLTAPLLEGVTTLNHHFRNHGYWTATRGKIYHGTIGSFADMKNWDDIAHLPGDYTLGGPKPLAGRAGQGNFDFGPTATEDGEMNDYRVASWAIGQLSRRRQQPLFLAAGIYRPHLPWYVPKQYFDLYPLAKIQPPIVREDDLDDIPAIGQKIARSNNDHQRITRAEAWKQAIQAYLACISFADAMIGRILRGLETGPYANDMDVILWSDHGWHLGEKVHWRKFTLWERATRNVLMARFSGVTKPGGTCPRPVNLLDIYPTLTDLCGLPNPGGFDGQSLRRWLANPKAPKREPTLTTFGRNNHAVRSEDWRYIRYRDGSEELYDRRSDPHEWTNLANNPRHMARKADLAQWLPKSNAPDAPAAVGGAPLENK